MAQFQAGQKLTAADLNNAFQGVAGVQNPTSDMKWYGTPMGRLQAAWSTFSNARNVAPRPADIAVAADGVAQPFVIEQGPDFDHHQRVPAYGVRRVFMNLGGEGQGFMSAQASLPYRVYPNCLRLGKYNHMPYLAVVGFQMPMPDAPWGRGEDPVFSLWYNDLNVPRQDTPEQWAAVQKLYQDNVCRNCSKDNWWYTGITVERCSPLAFQGASEMADIVAYPLFLRAKFEDGPRYELGDVTDQEVTLPVLCVSAYQDYLLRSMFLGKMKDRLKGLIETHFKRVWNIKVLDIYFLSDPELVKTVASFNWSSQTLDACYKQITNEISFQKEEDGGNKFKEFGNDSTPGQYTPGLFNYVDADGRHKSLRIEKLACTQPGGTATATLSSYSPAAVGAAYYKNSSGAEVFLPRYCPVPWTEYFSSDDPVSACLSSMFADLLSGGLSSSVQTRLIAVNQPGSEGWQYYDTCPDFSTGETPDSGISASCLSSIQEKDIELVSEEGQETQSQKLWSLWEFDNFENSKTYPEIQDNLSAYDLVVRHIDKRGEDTVGIVEYVHLSSLELSGGNLPDADVPAAGLSSIQTRTLDGGSKVLELYNFHDPAVETVYLSAQSRYDFVVRDNQDNCVKYANLSGIGGEVTLSGTDGSSGTGSEWKFQAFANSNISVHVSPQTIQLGCYYI